MDKVFVAQRVANKLWSTENAIDTAMVEASELMTALMMGRQEIKVSAGVTAEATAKLVAAIAALGQAREAMTDMHEELAEVKLRVGIRTKMTGIWDKPPQQFGVADQDIRQVG